MTEQTAYAVIRHNARAATEATFARVDDAIFYADRLATTLASADHDYVEQPSRFVWNLYCDGDLVDQVFLRKVRITIELD